MDGSEKMPFAGLIERLRDDWESRFSGNEGSIQFAK